MTRSPTATPFPGWLADNHLTMPVALTAPPADGAEAVCPETRVKALDVLSWPRVGVPSPESPDTHWENRRWYDGKAVGSVLARYYDPTTARWLQVDPASNGQWSPYRYANSNPPNGTDPTGQYCCRGHSSSSWGWGWITTVVHIWILATQREAIQDLEPSA